MRKTNEIRILKHYNRCNYKLQRKILVRKHFWSSTILEKWIDIGTGELGTINFRTAEYNTLEEAETEAEYLKHHIDEDVRVWKVV